MSTTPRLPALKTGDCPQRKRGRPTTIWIPPAAGTSGLRWKRSCRTPGPAGRKLVIFSVTPDAAGRMEGWFPGLFHFEDVRDDADYLYDARELAELPGRKFQKKRNLCSRFERDNPDWQFHPLTPDALPAVRRFNNEWCQLYDNRDDAGIADEHRAIELVFQHYGQLGLKGGYITAGGRIVAFSFGSALNPRIFDTHVEKALYDVTGAYNIINREMARTFCGGCQWINREGRRGGRGPAQGQAVLQSGPAGTQMAGPADGRGLIRGETGQRAPGGERSADCACSNREGREFMFRIAQPGDLPALCGLMKTAFGDEAEFTEMMAARFAGWEKCLCGPAGGWRCRSHALRGAGYPARQAGRLLLRPLHRARSPGQRSHDRPDGLRGRRAACCRGAFYRDDPGRSGPVCLLRKAGIRAGVCPRTFTRTIRPNLWPTPSLTRSPPVRCCSCGKSLPPIRCC